MNAWSERENENESNVVFVHIILDVNGFDDVKVCIQLVSMVDLEC